MRRGRARPLTSAPHMSDDLHKFVTTTLYAALKHDIHDLRVFNRLDLVNAGYFHIRRLLVIQPGWDCRAIPPAIDLAIYRKHVFQAALRFEFHLAPGGPNSLPVEEMNASMTALRQVVMDLEKSRPAGASGSAGRGYLVGAFDTDDAWFYPDEAVWEKQSVFWLPVNCRDFAEHDDWLARWDKSAAS
jgi:hypothetical protein